jgi:hypothetical protein
MNSSRGRIASLLVALLLAAPSAMADGIVDAQVQGDTLRAQIVLGSTTASLTVEFENVVGLSAANLGLSAATLNPLDPGLLARLDPSVSIPAAFPVLIRIEPPASGGLAFSGVVSIEIYTHALHYVPGSPLRMFAAPSGGAFRDITTSEGGGSYRSGGTRGTFSEFIIVMDLNGLSTVINGKFAALSQLLTEYAAQMSSTAQAELQSLYSAALTAWEENALVDAIGHIEDFGVAVEQYGGDAIPNVWRSAGDLDNVAGELRALAATLRYSLTVASNAL